MGQVEQPDWVLLGIPQYNPPISVPLYSVGPRPHWVVPVVPLILLILLVLLVLCPSGSIVLSAPTGTSAEQVRENGTSVYK